MPLIFNNMRPLIYTILISIGILTAYALQLANANEYLGYRNFDMTVTYLIGCIPAVFVIGLLTPNKIKKPSDFFSLFYGLFVLLPYATLYPIRGAIELDNFLLNFGTLMLPLVAIKLAALSAIRVRIPRPFSQSGVILIIVLICLTGLAMAFSQAPSSASFDLNVYDRRIEGRDVYSTGSVLAYLNSAVANSLGPFLAFIGGVQRKKLPLLISLACGIGFFYLLGVKAPILFIGLAWLIGRAYRTGTLLNFPSYLQLIILMVFGAFIFEFVVFGYSVVGDYFIRRTFTVPPYVLSAFFEFTDSKSFIPWSVLEGTLTKEPITFLIGESLLGQPEMNANTNTFIYQFTAGGIVMYFLTILLVACVFLVLDSSFRSTRNPALMYVAFSFSILIAEQAATTALISSGIALLVLLTMLTKANNTQDHTKLKFHNFKSS